MGDKFKDRINITKPYFPDNEELIPYLDRIRESSVLTNRGQIHQEFEDALCEYLGVQYISLFSSGTLALTLAIKSLNLSGEIITTPFTSVATPQAIVWNNLMPVFADIDNRDLNLDPKSVESLITNKTSAILPVHVFGNPCNVNEFKKLAEKFGLRLLYDAAHCFGVEMNDKTVCSFGDMSVLSFHATKVFNTIEGGAVISRDYKTKQLLDDLANTGQSKTRDFVGMGLNAKMNELQAAFGLIQLKKLDSQIKNRKTAVLKYRSLLKKLPGIRVLGDFDNIKHNYSYFPIIIEESEFGHSRDFIAERLEHNNIIPRKYFYPLVSTYREFQESKNPIINIAEVISKNILCLPLSDQIRNTDIARIVEQIKSCAI